jgi:sugar phosphate isomerase/epimerase
MTQSKLPGNIQRRRFLGAASVALLLSARTETSHAATDNPSASYTMDFCPGRIGVGVDQLQAIRFAKEYGFQSVEPLSEALAALSPGGVEDVLGKLRESRLVWGAAGLDVDFRRDEPAFREGMKTLAITAAALQRAGVERVGTWLSPGHGELTYMTNFRQHAARLREIARVYQDHGIRFGLEYVGPKTSWTSKRYPFVHTLKETLELIGEAGLPNLGVVLDSWHWYTAGETVADLKTLTNEQIIAVDLNDAPVGIERDQQIDNRRELPMATGVIDVTAFLTVLRELHYDGPIRAEPFNQSLNDLADEAAVEATAVAMKKAFAA